MTKLLEQAIAEARKLSENEQDELAELLLASMKIDRGPIKLDEETRAAVRRGLEEVREGKLATDEEVAAVFNRYRA
jgi:predicted transcriptional regulator